MFRLLTLIVLFGVFSAVVAQDNPPFPQALRDQIHEVTVRLAVEVATNEGTETLLRSGVLMTPTGIILTELDTIDASEMDYDCDSPDRMSVGVTVYAGGVATEGYGACLLTDKFDQIFAILQIETNPDGSAFESLPIAPLPFDNDVVHRQGEAIRSAYRVDDALAFEDGLIVAVDFVGRADIQHRHYLIDAETLEAEALGTPVLDAEGRLLGVIVALRVEGTQLSQLAQVVPARTVCLSDQEACGYITYVVNAIPDDRRQIPEAAVLIETGEVDLQARADMLCGRIGLQGGLADTDSGWGCFAPGGDAPIRDVSIPQIDDLCKEVYSDMDAFALLSGDDDERAYQWRCYRFEA